MATRSHQLQIRVTAEQKAALRRAARQAGQDLSAYVLRRALPDAQRTLAELVRGLRRTAEPRYALAELNDLLTELSAGTLTQAVSVMPPEMRELSAVLQNQVAAMVEQACHRRGLERPAWTRSVRPLAEPYFATALTSLRMHLLRNAPVAFRRRNIFVDACVGDRV